MKKSILVTFLLCVLAVERLSAQEQTYYGGVKGDWSVGFNLLTSGTEHQIRGTYMLTDRLVLDAGMLINDMNDFSEINTIFSNEGSMGKEQDYTIDNYTNREELTIGVNYLLRPGERLQPFVGGLLSVSRSSVYHKTDYDEKVVSGGDNLTASENWSYGLHAVFGVDYFFTPRVSLGGRISVGGLLEDKSEKGLSGNFDGVYKGSERHLYALRFRTTSSTVLLSFYF